MSRTISYPVLAPPSEKNPTSPLGLFVSAVVIISVAYSILSTGSMGGCLGGVSSDGGYVDGSGDPTTSAPICVMLQLRPQSYVYLILIAVAVIAMVVIRRRQARSLSTETVTIACLAVLIAVGALFSVYHLVFVQDALIGDWRSGGDVVLPLLSNVTIDRSAW